MLHTYATEENVLHVMLTVGNRKYWSAYDIAKVLFGTPKHQQEEIKNILEVLHRDMPFIKQIPLNANFRKGQYYIDQPCLFKLWQDSLPQAMSAPEPTYLELLENIGIHES